jgi:RNA polymerase sigma-70 factor (ECF subfamily)
MSECWEDDALVRGMIAGDAGAWEVFHTRHTPALSKVIERAMMPFGRASDDDVREVHSSLVLSLLAHDKKKLRAFDPARGARFSSFVALLAVHAAFDHLRSMRRSPWPAPFHEAEDVASDELDPYEQTWRRLHAARVIEALGEKDRAFVALYLGEGLGFDEIAARLRVSVKTVYSKKHKLQLRLASLKAC